MLTFENLFKQHPNNSFKVVFPQLPVIAIIFVFMLRLKIFEVPVKKSRVFLTLICLLILSFF